MREVVEEGRADKSTVDAYNALLNLKEDHFLALEKCIAMLIKHKLDELPFTPAARKAEYNDNQFVYTSTFGDLVNVADLDGAADFVTDYMLMLRLFLAKGICHLLGSEM